MNPTHLVTMILEGCAGERIGSPLPDEIEEGIRRREWEKSLDQWTS